MSGMEAFAAAATIFTFIETGLKLSNKAIAVYKGRDELPGLQLMIAEFQKSNQEFISGLKLRSTRSDSGKHFLHKPLMSARRLRQNYFSLLTD